MSLRNPIVDCEMVHPSILADDIAAAVDFYVNRLGFTEAFTFGEPPTMAGLNLGDVQIFVEKGTPDPRGSGIYFVVGDADELHEFHRVNGVNIVEAPKDQPWGLRDYAVRDLNGYAITFGHRLPSAMADSEPLVIERIDVPVRLEKRLAGLVHDLAAHKRMSVTSCLEEILLHTNEPLGDGVASPHTKATLRHIQELKKKHGIDYDSHASYRFVERAVKP